LNRAELGALRDAIHTILSWPDPVGDQIAQWLQTDGAGRGRSSLSRSNRPPGFKPGVRESAAREQALPEAMRDHRNRRRVEGDQRGHDDWLAIFREADLSGN
jgi:hypothetical protein